jgi:signal peptidase II
MMGLIVAGAAGNFIDRFRQQYVIDFFDLGWWPVFNVADMAVVAGGCLLVLYMLFFMKEG